MECHNKFIQNRFCVGFGTAKCRIKKMTKKRLFFISGDELNETKSYQNSERRHDQLMKTIILDKQLIYLVGNNNKSFITVNDLNEQ